MMTHPQAPASRLLLIDSNVFFAKRLSEALRYEGFDVVHATHGLYGLSSLEYDPPKAILCATAMREMGAYEVARIVNGDTASAQIPVIAMGEGGEQSLMDAFRAGCDDYVDRRLAPEQIAAHVRSFLRSRDEGFHPTQMLGSAEAVLSGNLSHLDLPGVIQMLSHSRQAGALHINCAAIDGVLFFEAGDLSHAEAGELVGDDAVLHIVRNCNGVEEGIYKFVPGATAATRTVLRSATELMLEALRQLDEEQGEEEVLS